MSGYFIVTKENPESAITFPEPYIRQLFAKFGLSISEPIQFGSWCGRQQFFSYQDIVIAKKN